jgi:hypothetical protein
MFDYSITGNFCGQLKTAEIKIAEYYVKCHLNMKPSQLKSNVKPMVSNPMP